MLVLHDVIVTAAERLPDAYRGAVYHERRLVEESLRSRKGSLRVADPDVLDPEFKPEIEIDAAIYLGHMFNHFGHFLIETLPALHWAIDYPSTIVMHPYPGARHSHLKLNYANFCLDALGISPSRILLATEAMRVGTMHLPIRLEPRAGRSVPETMVVYEIVAKAAEAASTMARGERVYFSRARYPQHRLVIENEQEAEAIFTERGFSIVYPETLRFEDQVAICRRAKIVAGLCGSALHLSAFMAAGGRVIAVGKRVPPALTAISRLRGLEVTSLDCVSGDYRKVPHRESISVGTLNALLHERLPD